MCIHINKALIVTSQSRKKATGDSHSRIGIHLLCPSSGGTGVIERERGTGDTQGQHKLWAMTQDNRKQADNTDQLNRSFDWHNAIVYSLPCNFQRVPQSPASSPG